MAFLPRVRCATLGCVVKPLRGRFFSLQPRNLAVSSCHRIVLLFVACSFIVVGVKNAAAVEQGKAPKRHNTLTETELADGWLLLFDGKTMFGWKANGKADWRVADGTIVVTSGEKSLAAPRAPTVESSYAPRPAPRIRPLTVMN